MSSAATRRPNMRTSPVTRSHTHGDGGSRMSSAPSADFPRSQRNQDVEIEGVYKNSAFTFHLTTLLGCTVEVHVQNGKHYEGILKTFSSDLEVALDCAHLIDPANRERVPTKNDIIDTLIINFSDLVTMTAVNADTKYGETDTFTDAAISKSQMNGVKERELTPFIMESSDAALEHSLEELTSNTSWTPEKMFQHHEERFGVKSDFNEEDYTTKLPSANTPHFEQRRAEAERMAAQIENSSLSRRNAAVENDEGRDEEARFSAVSGSPVGAINNRYTPPQIRNRDRGSKAILSQSMRVNGRDGLKNSADKYKPKAVTSPTEGLEKLKKWNNNFHLKSGNTTNTPTESQSPPKQDAKVESEAKAAPSSKSPTTSGQHADVKVMNVSPSASDSQSDASVASQSKSDASVASQSKSPSSVDSISPEKSAKIVSEVDDVASKSSLNPEAKEFVFAPKALSNIVPSPAPPPQQQQPPPQPPTPQHQQQFSNSKSSKTVTVSLLDSRQPTKSVEMGNSGAGSYCGAPLQQPQYAAGQYFVMTPNARFQRMASYPGNEPQPGQPHSLQNPSFLPHPFVPTPVMSGHQPMGHISAPSYTHNGQMHHSMPGQPGPPPNALPNPATPGQPLHPPGAPAFNPGGYPVNPVYQIPVPSATPQQAAGGQPPVQTSSHNPSPSPAPMTNGNGPSVSYTGFHQHPQPQQFYTPPMGPHAVSQAQSYGQPQQVLYIHPGPAVSVHSQYPTPVYQHAGYPMGGYPQSYPGTQ